jgi:hypothetical protein
MLSIRYRPPFWNITRNNGTLHEIKGLQGVLGCFAKTKKNIIMLSMTYKNKNDYITKPVILGITSAESICGIPRKSKIVFLEHWNIVTLSKTYTKKMEHYNLFNDLAKLTRHAASRTGIGPRLLRDTSLF